MNLDQHTGKHPTQTSPAQQRIIPPQMSAVPSLRIPAHRLTRPRTSLRCQQSPEQAPLHQTTDISTSAGAALELMSPFSPPNLAKSLPRIIWVQREHREDRESKLIRGPESEPTVSLKNNSLMVYLINRTTKLSFKGPAPLCEGTQYFFFLCYFAFTLLT